MNVGVLVLSFMIAGAAVVTLLGTLPADGANPATISISIVPGAAGDPYYSLGYSPASAEVTIGFNNTVTWKNDDNTPHTATSNSGAFDSGNLDAGQSYTFTFANPGTFQYVCVYHAWMQGTIIVTGQSTTTTTTATTTTPPIPEFPNSALALILFVLVVTVVFVLARTQKKSNPSPTGKVLQ